MNQKTVPVAFALTQEEYKQLAAACAKANTYPSAAVREAVMEWMEKRGGNG